MMDLDDLRIFRAVVHEGGITRAALQLHRVQSNVTTRVRQLEASLGVDLFRRGRLRLGSMESTAAARLPASLAEFHARYPDVRLELRTGATAPILLELIGGQLDCALVCGPVEDARLEAVPIYEEELMIAAPAKHPAIRSARDVQARTLLTFAPGCAYRPRLEAWLAADNVVPERVVELSSYHAMLGCVASGMGIALVPRSLLAMQPQGAALSTHRLSSRFAQATTFLAHRRGMANPAVGALEEILRASGREEEARQVA